MPRLVSQYKSFALKLFGLATICNFLMIQVISPRISPYFSSLGLFGDILFFLLTETSIYLFIFLIPLFLYERLLWKWMNPDIDFSGIWSCEIGYDCLERPYGRFTEKTHVPKQWSSFVTIQQTPFFIKMIEGIAREGETWHSTAIDIVEENTLWMAYQVDREFRNDPNYPVMSLGIKKIKILARDKHNRPEIMLGIFYHAAIPNVPLFRGTTKFKRSSLAERRKDQQST